jgi:hypothetical protein
MPAVLSGGKTKAEGPSPMPRLALSGESESGCRGRGGGAPSALPKCDMPGWGRWSVLALSAIGAEPAYGADVASKSRHAAALVEARRSSCDLEGASGTAGSEVGAQLGSSSKLADELGGKGAISGAKSCGWLGAGRITEGPACQLPPPGSCAIEPACGPCAALPPAGVSKKACQNAISSCATPSAAPLLRADASGAPEGPAPAVSTKASASCVRERPDAALPGAGWNHTGCERTCAPSAAPCAKPAPPTLPLPEPDASPGPAMQAERGGPEQAQSAVESASRRGRGPQSVTTAWLQREECERCAAAGEDAARQRGRAAGRRAEAQRSRGKKLKERRAGVGKGARERLWRGARRCAAVHELGSDHRPRPRPGTFVRAEWSMQAQLGLLLGAASPSGASCLSLLGLRVACLVRTICCAVFQRYGRTPGRSEQRASPHRCFPPCLPLLLRPSRFCAPHPRLRCSCNAPRSAHQRQRRSRPRIASRERARPDKRRSSR